MRCIAPIAALSGALAMPAAAEVTSLDLATDWLTIPSVSVGADSYTQVRLRHQGNYVFTLEAFTPQLPPAPGVASYDAARQLLSIPAVRVGDTTYLDVTLQNTGNFRFVPLTATPLPPLLSEQIRSLLARYDSLYANDLPSSTQAVSLFDRCWRHDGIDHDWVAAGRHAAGLDEIGRRSENIQVTALRDTLNGDGSTRREIDLEYDIHHRDGTVTRRARERLISGSSAGTLRCPSAQAEEALRFYGNQRWVGVGTGWRSTRAQGYSIINGQPFSPPQVWRRDVQFLVVDPMSNATYAVVTGAGIGSRKLISPRLAAAAAEFGGKRGNYINLAADHPFMFCRAAGSSVPLASVAHCVAEGAGGYDLGFSTATPNAAADASFAALGFVPGGVYRFDIHDDDGWKTVNGQAGRTPLATYYTVLDDLGPAFEGWSQQIPLLTPTTLTLPQLHANVLSPIPNSVAFHWAALGPLPDGRSMPLQQAWQVHQGPKAGNAAGVAWPAYRRIEFIRPGSGATAYPNWPVLALHPDQGSKTYTDFTLQFRERGSFNEVLSVLLMQ